MCRTTVKMEACAFLSFVLLAVANAGETRNYWSECFAAGKKSQADFLAYVDSLSIQEIMLLGRQAGEECQQKLQETTDENKQKVEDEYVAALGMVSGRFLENAKVSDKHRLFAEPVADPQSPAVWRKTLLLGLLERRSDDAELIRWNDYALIGILDGVLRSTQEAPDIRRLSCRVTGLILQSEHRKPPKAEKEKQSLSKKISYNVDLCKRLLNEPNAPTSLIRMVEGTLQRYKEAGISEAEIR